MFLSADSPIVVIPSTAAGTVTACTIVSVIRLTSAT